MKDFGFSINVNKDTNYIIGHTESDWSALRKNSLVSIGDDGHFYNIGNIEPLNFITDFTVDNDKLKIDGNYENYFIADDILTISYKEYELLTVLNIKNKGSNYKVNDILSLNGGILSVNTVDNQSQNTLFQVEEVDGGGGINKLKILNKGIYLKYPDKENALLGGKGKDGLIIIESSLIKERKMIERQVVSARNQDSNTIIELNYKLPENITEGKISMNKFKGLLTSNYIGETKRDTNYVIIRDFTPFYGLPLLVKGGNKLEETYNHSILELEKRIKDLEDKVSKLSNV